MLAQAPIGRPAYIERVSVRWCIAQDGQISLPIRLDSEMLIFITCQHFSNKSYVKSFDFQSDEVHMESNGKDVSQFTDVSILH